MAQHARPQQAEHHLEPSRTGLGKVNPHWTLDEDELARRVRVYLRTFAPGQYCTTKELEQAIEFKDLGSTPWASAALCRMALKKLAELPSVVSPRLARAFNRGKTIRRRALGSPRAGVRSGVLSYL